MVRTWDFESRNPGSIPGRNLHMILYVLQAKSSGFRNLTRIPAMLDEYDQT
jgi:hypothetical protein